MMAKTLRAYLPLVDHLAVEDGHVDLRLLDGFRRNGEDVIGEDNEVGELAGFDGAFDLLLVLGVGRPMV
jgi:hypothetical protein